MAPASHGDLLIDHREVGFLTEGRVLKTTALSFGNSPCGDHATFSRSDQIAVIPGKFPQKSWERYPGATTRWTRFSQKYLDGRGLELGSSGYTRLQPIDL